MSDKLSKPINRGKSNIFNVEINSRGISYYQAISDTTQVPVTSSEMLQAIKSRLQKRYYSKDLGTGLLVGISGVILLIFLRDGKFDLLGESALFTYVILGITWIVGPIILRYFHHLEEKSHITQVYYKVDDTHKQLFSDFLKSISPLAQSNVIWNVPSRTPTDDWKRNAGATETISRKRITVGYLPCPFIKTNVKTLGIGWDAFQLFFLPDCAWIFQSREYKMIPYNVINTRSEIVTFIENEIVPKDADVTEYTWRYLRKDGGPDLRFSNNRRLPIVRYGCIIFNLSITTVQLYISNVLYVESLAGVFEHYSRCLRHEASFTNTSYRDNASNQQTKSDRQQKTHSQKNIDDPYVILGVSQTASKEEIVAAYRKMAQMYHPDKVANLAPEFKELAETRMKAINTAYDELKKKF